MNPRPGIAWIPVIALPAVTVWATRGMTGWVVMWALSVAIFLGAKWLSWFAAPLPQVPAWRALAYWAGWPGLDARGFLAGKALRVPLIRWVSGAALAFMGALLLLVGAPALLKTAPELLAAWTGMLGIILLLHFGVMAVISCFWNAIGVRAMPLMRCPIAASTVAEFWSERWNTAFRDLSTLAIFRPLARRWGARAAAFAVFLFSGIVHDVVVSVPARGGYGKPTLYFLLQWLAIALQRSALGRSLGLRGGWRGRLFTLSVLVLPLGLLFHPEFAMRVIYPLVETIANTIQS